MKRFVTALIVAALLFAVSPSAFAISADSAGAAILIHADSGEVLYEKNSSEPMLIASTTKIMTALIVLERCSPDELVVIKPEYTGIEGSSMYLEAGQEYSVRDLLYGMMLASGNDAATALACYTAGSVENFVRLMNRKARALGLEDTQFENPHGLDAEGHHGTAHDLAVIMQAAIKNETFRAIVATKSVTIGEQTFVNHNKLLWRYDGCLGGKTGYTMAAGRSLVSVAERNGLCLICVTLSDPDDWDTHMALYDWAFDTYCCEAVSPPEKEMPLTLISGRAETVKVGCLDELHVLRKKDEQYTCKIELPPFVYAPVKRGDILGCLTVTASGETLGSVNICALEDAPRDETIKLTAWERFKLSWYRTNRLGTYYPGL
ncbi:MAG: D-alanyl-D-alanine carboxypeptidase family protein [Oscillospiraceae bacterium]